MNVKILKKIGNFPIGKEFPHSVSVRGDGRTSFYFVIGQKKYTLQDILSCPDFFKFNSFDYGRFVTFKNYEDVLSLKNKRISFGVSTNESLLKWKPQGSKQLLTSRFEIRDKIPEHHLVQIVGQSKEKYYLIRCKLSGFDFAVNENYIIPLENV